MADFSSVAEDRNDGQAPQRRAGAAFAGEVRFENVAYHVGPLAVVNGISTTFEAGKVSCLLGPSGCGKTTLLRLAAGVASPTAGQIFLDGREVAGPGVFVPPEQRGVGLMFQDYALFPHLTIVQNVAFGLTALQRSEARVAALNALERVGLAHMAERYPGKLSGGEQQRVALARAIVPRPQVLLMDEPFSGLDLGLKEQVRRDTLAIVRETRATAVLVTHDPMEAVEFADHIILMRHGRIAQEGPPSALLNNPVDLAAARFFSAYNVFSAVVLGGKVQIPVGTVRLAGFGEGERVDILLPFAGLAPVTAPDGGSMEGYVRDARFLGPQTRLSVMFQSHDVPVTIDVSSSTSIAAGRTLHFNLNQESVVAFKKQP
jgi:iron(III) transport system ATP-binding protein